MGLASRLPGKSSVALLQQRPLSGGKIDRCFTQLLALRHKVRALSIQSSSSEGTISGRRSSFASNNGEMQMANKKRVGLLIAMALAAPAAVNAQGFFDNPPGFDNRFYIEPFGSYTWGNSNTKPNCLRPCLGYPLATPLIGGQGNVNGMGAGLTSARSSTAGSTWRCMVRTSGLAESRCRTREDQQYSARRERPDLSPQARGHRAHPAVYCRGRRRGPGANARRIRSGLVRYPRFSCERLRHNQVGLDGECRGGCAVPSHGQHLGARRWGLPLAGEHS